MNNNLKQIKSTAVGIILLVFSTVYYFDSRKTDDMNIYLLVTLICFGVVMLFAADRLIDALLDGIEALLKAFAARVRGGKDTVELKATATVSADLSSDDEQQSEEEEIEPEAKEQRAEEPEV